MQGNPTYNEQERIARQLEAVEGHGDTSATAMVFWAIGLAMKHRPQLLEETRARQCADLAEQGLRSWVRDGRIYESSGECIDFAMYPQNFGNNAWGQGAALAFLALRQEN